MNNPGCGEGRFPHRVEAEVCGLWRQSAPRLPWTLAAVPWTLAASLEHRIPKVSMTCQGCPVDFSGAF
jgi:hypothetical protein